MTDDSGKPKKIKVKPNNIGSRKISYKWVITILIWTFFISCIMQVAQEGLMSKVNIIIAALILITFIMIGIIFDIIGVSVTAASEIPFHSLSSKKVRGAKEAIRLIRNADKVGNFCNDVIGDITGIISGSASVAIVAMINGYMKNDFNFILSILLTGLVAALTVGGKAVGKGIALLHCNSIIFWVGKVVSVFHPVKNRNGNEGKNHD